MSGEIVIDVENNLEELTLKFLTELRDHHGYDDPDCFMIHELIAGWEAELNIKSMGGFVDALYGQVRDLQLRNIVGMECAYCGRVYESTEAIRERGAIVAKKDPWVIVERLCWPAYTRKLHAQQDQLKRIDEWRRSPENIGLREHSLDAKYLLEQVDEIMTGRGLYQIVASGTEECPVCGKPAFDPETLRCTWCGAGEKKPLCPHCKGTGEDPAPGKEMNYCPHCFGTGEDPEANEDE